MAPLIGAAQAHAKLAFQRGGAIWIAHDDGSGAHRIAWGSSPTISPDGRLVAFARGGDKPQARVVSATGGTSRLAAANLVDIGPWDPRSHTLVVAVEGGLDQVIVGRVITRRRIARPAEFCGGDFAPDGRLAYSDCGQVRTLEASLKPSTSRNLGDGQQPTWGARGLAFSDTLANPSDPSGGVTSSKLIFSANGGRPELLLDVDRQQTAAIGFAASGRRLLATVGPTVMIFDIGSQPQTVAVTGRPTAISRDGLSILSSADDGAHVTDLRTGVDNLVVAGASSATWTA